MDMYMATWKLLDVGYSDAGHDYEVFACLCIKQGHVHGTQICHDIDRQHRKSLKTRIWGQGIMIVSL